MLSFCCIFDGKFFNFLISSLNFIFLYLTPPYIKQSILPSIITVTAGSNINYTDNTIADFAQTANKYIDTHVALYNETNYEKDYEVGFTIVSYDGSSSGNSNSQATIFNAKLENQSLNYPGIVFRKNNNGS